MAEVKFTIQSISDLEDIAEYISKDSPHYARLQIQKLINRTDILEQFPFIGRVVPELKAKLIREVIEGNYRIVYRIVNKSLIHILTFHHTRRRFKISEIRKRISKNR
jgi:addiction module RelE/StbE family toxin